MVSKVVKVFAVAFFLIAGATLVYEAGLADQGHDYGAATAPGVSAPIASDAPTVRQVETSKVCMVNNTVMGKPQILVKVDGKDYYGCCAGCAGKLKKNKDIRYSTDPVTGKKVDKATAFIMEGPDGAALYFESKDSAGKYVASLKTEKK